MSRSAVVGLAVVVGLALGWGHHVWTTPNDNILKQPVSPSLARVNPAKRPEILVLQGTVSDENGQPISGATIELFRLNDDALQPSDVAYAAHIKEDEFGVHENLGVVLGPLPAIPNFAMGEDAGPASLAPSLAEERVQRTRTQADGKFSISWPEPRGKYFRLLCTASGYAPTFSSVIKTSTSIDLRMKSQRAVALMPPLPSAEPTSMQGQIVEDPSQSAVVGARVVAKDENGKVLGSATTGIDGMFSITITSGSAQSAPNQVEIVRAGFATTSAAWPRGEKGPHIFHLSKGGGLRGVVLDRFGTPIARAVVFLDQGGTDNTAFRTTTNDKGQFELRGVPQGIHMLYTSHPNAGSVAQSVRAWAGQTVSRITVHLPDRQ